MQFKISLKLFRLSLLIKYQLKIKIHGATKQKTTKI